MVAVAMVCAIVVVRVATRAASGVGPRRSRGFTRDRVPRATPTYDWDRRRDQLYRQVKRVEHPNKQRAEMIRWIDAHRGVEAYMEPKTMMHPLSVVLIDEEGESRRFELTEDASVRKLAGARRIRVFDASRVGYPDRMRRRRER